MIHCRSVVHGNYIVKTFWEDMDTSTFVTRVRRYEKSKTYEHNNRSHWILLVRERLSVGYKKQTKKYFSISLFKETSVELHHFPPLQKPPKTVIFRLFNFFKETSIELHHFLPPPSPPQKKLQKLQKLQKQWFVNYSTHFKGNIRRVAPLFQQKKNAWLYKFRMFTGSRTLLEHSDPLRSWVVLTTLPMHIYSRSYSTIEGGWVGGENGLDIVISSSTKSTGFCLHMNKILTQS